MTRPWVWTGIRENRPCPLVAAEGMHNVHLWSPTVGNPCDEDQQTEDIYSCTGGFTYDPEESVIG